LSVYFNGKKLRSKYSSVEHSLVVSTGLDFECTNHLFVLNSLRTFAVSESYMLLCSKSDDFSIYDSKSFTEEDDEGIENLEETVKGNVKSMVMNDEYIFILCSDSQVKVFSMETFDLVETIDVFADQMKLISDRYIAFFNAKFSFLYFYDQKDFEKEEEFDLVDSVEDGLQMATDNSPYVSFSNSKILKWAFVDF
jgi:hypothetical protein